MDVVTLGAALSIMKKMPDTAASSAAAAGASATAAQQAQQAAEAAAEQAEGAIEVDDTLSVKGRAADAKVTGDEISDLNSDLNLVADEINIALPVRYSGITSATANEITTIVDDIQLDLATEYEFTFSLDSAINTATYFGLYNGESKLFSRMLNAGETSVSITYTTSASTPASGLAIRARVNKSGVPVKAEINYTTAPASRIDLIEQSVNSLGRVVFSGTHSYAGGSENWQTFTPSPNTKLAIRIPDNDGYSVEVALYTGRWTVVETISDSDYRLVDVPSNISNKVIFTYRGESAVTLSFLVVDVTNANTTKDVANLNNRLDAAESGLISANSQINYLFKSTGSFAISEHDGYLTSNGTYYGTSNYHSLTTDKIACYQGDVFKYKGTASSNSVAALFYDANDSIIGFDRTNSGSAYSDITVPVGAVYAVFSSYATKGAKITFDVATDLYLKMNQESLFATQPLTAMPSYICKNLAYKPLGQLEKSYLCLVSDDGNALLNTYTIPMVLAKGVPCTFALMSASDVMQTQADIDIVKNAVENGGCSVAQHGEHYWTTYSEKELTQFFDTEKAFFDNAGITLEGAVLPGHYANDMVLALAGGRFGVVRSGYDGAYGGRFVNYQYLTSGARSNLYCLTSYNIVDKSLQTHKTAIDYAVANNKLIFIYWHENALTEDTKALLENVIDYAKTTSINFITLGDVLGII